jgi:hypothetical protein
MSQKKRTSNPIRITLTEDQISDIIQSAAKTRRGLKVESLEDRIAPSAIGVPMMGDPLTPPENPPTFVAPLPDGADLPPTNVDPIVNELPPTNVEPIGGELPPTNVDPINDLPPTNVPPIGFDGPVGPPVPPTPPAFPGAPDAAGESGPTPPSNPNNPTPPQNDFLGGDPSGPTQPHVPTPGGSNAPVAPDAPVADASSGGNMPSSEEIEEHRRNILRQLRGN